MPKQTKKPIPEFAAEADERRFWETHDSVDFVDWSTATSIRFPNLKLSTETISLRLPAGLLADLKALANKRDVPYQSLLKVFLADRVAREWRASGRGGDLQKRRPQPAEGTRRKAGSRKRPRTARD